MNLSSLMFSLHQFAINSHDTAFIDAKDYHVVLTKTVSIKASTIDGHYVFAVNNVPFAFNAIRISAYESDFIDAMSLLLSHPNLAKFVVDVSERGQLVTRYPISMLAYTCLHEPIQNVPLDTISDMITSLSSAFIQRAEVSADLHSGIIGKFDLDKFTIVKTVNPQSAAPVQRELALSPDVSIDPEPAYEIRKNTIRVGQLEATCKRPDLQHSVASAMVKMRDWCLGNADLGEYNMNERGPILNLYRSTGVTKGTTSSTIGAFVEFVALGLDKRISPDMFDGDFNAALACVRRSYSQGPDLHTLATCNSAFLINKMFFLPTGASFAPNCNGVRGKYKRISVTECDRRGKRQSIFYKTSWDSEKSELTLLVHFYNEPKGVRVQESAIIPLKSVADCRIIYNVLAYILKHNLHVLDAPDLVATELYENSCRHKLPTNVRFFTGVEKK